MILSSDDFAGEGIAAPAREVACRHDVGMAGEDEMGRTRADPGEEIIDVGRSRLREGKPMRLEADGFQRPLDDIERARVRRRHGGAADEVAGQGDGGGEGHDQKAFGKPACFRTSLAVCRDLVVLGNEKFRWVMGLCQISWLPLPGRTIRQPAASSSATSCE